MKPGSFFIPALLVAVTLAPVPASATEKLYDMTPLLNQPDPFEPVVPPAYRPTRTMPAPLPASMPRLPPPPAAARPRTYMPAAASSGASLPAPVEMPSPAPVEMPSRRATPMAPTPLMVPIGREPPSDSTIRPIGRLPTGMTPQR